MRTTQRDIDDLLDDDEQLPEVQTEPLPVARPGQQWVNAARRNGQDDEYDNMLADRYGDGW